MVQDAFGTTSSCPDLLRINYATSPMGRFVFNFVKRACGRATIDPQISSADA
jgi:hypothetical protein